MKTRLIGLLSLFLFSVSILAPRGFAQSAQLAWPGARGSALDYTVLLNHAWINQVATVKISPGIGGALYPTAIQPTVTRSGDTLRVHFNATQSAKLQNDTYVVISTGGTVRYTGYLSLGGSVNTGGTVGGTTSWNLIPDKPNVFPSSIELIPGLTTALGNLLPSSTYDTFLAGYTTAINNLNTAQLTKLTKAQADLLYMPIGPASGGAISRTYTFVLGINSNVVSGTNVTNQIIIENPGTISKAWINAKTAPVGADLIVDIKLNGISIWSAANRLKLTDGSTTGSQASFNTTSVTPGQLLTLDVTQVGSTTPGKNVTIQLVINQ